MTTFKQFLNEAPAEKKSALPKNVSKSWDKENLQIDQMIDLVNEHCRESLRAIYNPHALLFRGFKQPPGPEGKPVLLDSTNSLRMSRDSNNLYQLMMDRSKHFAGYPSRSKSFICSTSMWDARSHTGFGVKPYVMIPFNDTTVAYVNTEDMFNSEVGKIAFSRALSKTSVEDFSNILQHLLTDLGLRPDNASRFEDAQKINAALSKIPVEVVAAVFFNKDILNHGDPDRDTAENYFANWRDIPDAEFARISSALFSPMIAKNTKIVVDAINKYKLTPKFKSVLDIFRSFGKQTMFDDISSAIMTPSQLKVKVTTAGKSMGGDVECWFSGKCVAIPLDLFEKMLAKMKKNGTNVHPTVWGEHGT